MKENKYKDQKKEMIESSLSSRREFLKHFGSWSSLGLWHKLTASLSLLGVTQASAQLIPHGMFKNRSSPYINIIITSNTQNFNLRAVAMAAPYNWDGASAKIFTVTVNSGIYIWSDLPTLPAFATGAMTTGSTLSLINNGFIIAKGGAGASFAGSTNYPATAGGDAINTTCPIAITNTSGYIGGGGGGGAGNPNSYFGTDPGYANAQGGGGAGGGNGGSFNSAIGVVGSGGAFGAAGANGISNGTTANGGGGGRLIPPGAGSAGVGNTAGGSVSPGLGGYAGGSGSMCYTKGIKGYSLFAAGGGGGWGAVGGYAIYYSNDITGGPDFFGTSGAGGSGTSAGGNASAPGGSFCANPSAIPAVGGAAVRLNGNSIVWVGGTSSSSRVYGSVA